MRLLLAIAACGVTLLALLVQPRQSVVIPTGPDHVSYAVHAGALCIFLCLYLLYAYEKRVRPDIYHGRRSAGLFMGAGVLLGFATAMGMPFTRELLAGRTISGNESAAVNALRRIAAGQERFRSEDLDGDGGRDYAEGLGELTSVEGLAFPEGLPEAIRSIRPKQWRGYYFAPMRGGWDGPFESSERYGVQAVPAEYGRTGVRTFYVTGGGGGGGGGVVYGRDIGGAPVIIEPRDVGENWRPVE